MAQPQLRPGAFVGAARISGNGTLVYSIGVITSINKTGVGIYELGLSPGVNPGEHTFKVQPILGFAAEASGSVNVDVTPPLLQTVVGGVAADLDCYIEITRVRTADGTILPSPPPVPAVPPPPPGSGDVVGPASSTDNAIVRFNGVTGKAIDESPANVPTVDDAGKMALLNVLIGTGVLGGTPVSGAGTRIMWIPAKAAFRVGVVTGTEWDDANIGINSFASGNDSIANGTDSTAMGDGCNASGSNSFAAGRSCNASASEAIAMGTSCTASNQAAVAMGSNTQATGEHSTALGRNSVATEKALATGADSNARLIGTHSHSSGGISVNGDAQTTVAPISRQTTDATLTELTLENIAPSSSSRLILPDDTTWAFSVLVVARNTAAVENAAYKFEGAIKRDAGAGTTALVGTVTKTVLAEDVAAWDVVVDADTVNGNLRVRAQGQAAKTINWHARCTLSEVTG